MSGIRLGIVAVALGALGAVAAWLWEPDWFPVRASVQAQRHDQLFGWLLVMSSFILAIVTVFLVYSMVKFRARAGDESDGPPVHGHTLLEVVWTVIPATIVTFFAIYGGIVLARNESLSSDRLIVDVTGRQFAWSYYYPDSKVHTGILDLPVGRQVEFILHVPPNDVIHDFYVPAFRVKEDAVPGITTTLVATPTRIGTYAVVCNELCGIGHSQMRSLVNVVTPQKYEAWIALQKRLASAPPSSGGGAVDAKMVFQQNCGSCHTLSAAGTNGTVGPNLDHLAADAQKYGNGESEAGYVRDSIVDPSKVVVTGFPDHVMPSTFKSTLSAAQIAALVKLLTKAGS